MPKMSALHIIASWGFLAWAATETILHPHTPALYLLYIPWFIMLVTAIVLAGHGD